MVIGSGFDFFARHNFLRCSIPVFAIVTLLFAIRSIRAFFPDMRGWEMKYGGFGRIKIG